MPLTFTKLSFSLLKVPSLTNTWQVADGRPEAEKYDFTKWFHDLYRPSLRPYDPKEIDVIKRFNALADEE